MAIDWTIEELQQAIDEIVSGERLVNIETKGGIRYVLFKYPTRKAIRLADIQMEQTIAKAIKDKHLTEEQMLEIIKERKIWTEKDDEVVEELRERIIKWQDKLKNPDITTKSRDTILEAVKGFEEKIFEAEYKKEIMMVNTAERKGRQSKYEYLVYFCSYDPESEERIWGNYLTYCRCMDTELKNRLLGELLRYLSGRTTAEVRFIARSNLWRISYSVAQKTNTPLYPNAVIDLTPDQTNLAWWSSYYQGINEMMPEDQPPDSIVEDDEALDKFMEELHKERAKERQDARKDRKNPFGSKSARHMKEQLIMQGNPEYLDLEYDKIPQSKIQGDQTESTLRHEAPAGSKAAKQRTTPIKGSKRFRKKTGD